MTGQEIRDLGYLKWKDPWAWMETMKGKKWDNMMKREKEHYNELASQPHVKREARHIEEEIKKVQQYDTIPGFLVGCGTIEIRTGTGSRFAWKWIWSKTFKPAYDIDVKGNIVWYITSDEDKHYKNLLICEDSAGKQIWKKDAVSSQIAVKGEHCYFVKVTDVFHTSELCVCNARTGHDEHVLYKEYDKERDIVLIKASNRTLYFKSSDPVDSKLYKIKDLAVHQIEKTSKFQIPLGQSIYGDDCVLVRKTPFDKWVQKGKPLADWILPNEEFTWISLQSGIVVTIKEGTQTIWHCSPNKNPKSIFKIKAGTIDPHRFSSWENMVVQSFIIRTPIEIPYMIHIVNNKVIRDDRESKPIKDPIQFKPLEIQKHHVKSRDGTNIPFIIIKEKGIKPKAQLIYVYGAYGASTPIDWPYSQWYSLLSRKWALVFALVRGGGDDDEAWAEVARRNNRHIVVEDFEAVIRGAQHKNCLKSNKTVIYGRSAGGLPVGAIVGRFPDGNLVGAAFTEVPYVDVLRTSTNPDLPLTIGEFQEFGNPLEKILNFKELMGVSPVDTVPPDGAPGVFVMSRVGLLDQQVLAYESFKWIQKLRGYMSLEESNLSHPKGKYVTIEKKEDHHYSAGRFPRFRAIDFAILDSWVDGKLKLF